MQAFSYSANHFSKEDTEHELSKVTDIEKEEILDDKYGRLNSKGTKNNIEEKGANIDTEENDNGDDITDKMLDEFHEAIAEIPPDMSRMFWRACLEADEIGDNESDPGRFLRCENYDPKKAAVRMCEYWNTRYEVFGEDDAVKPLTLDGAMKSIIPIMVQIPTFFRILPNDDHGRTVVCLDRTGIRFKDYDNLALVKIFWFVFHMALRKTSTQQDGVVFIIVNQTNSWDFPSTTFIRLATKSVGYCIPVKVLCRHSCLSSLVVTLLLPIIQYLTPRHTRLRAQIHNSLNKTKILTELGKFGLQQNNLPTSIGGKYDENPPWFDECEQMLINQKGASLREKRQRKH